MKKRILLGVVLLFCFGCERVTQSDGTTGLQLDPNTAAKIEAGVEGSAGILAALTPLLGPAAAVVATGLLSGLGIWRKLKPQLMDARGKEEIAHAAAVTLISAIEELKKTHPDTWKTQLEPLINKTILTVGLDPKVVENIIRGIRGLPPKG